jgi:HK97 gp10 family phage protein
MPRFGSLTEMADYFTALSFTTDEVSKRAMTKAAKLVRDEAKRVLGTYDYGWTPLAQATVDHKRRGDTPLLETGDLRNSIKYSVSEHEFTVGSNSPKALWHELGTSRVPPRSFIGGAAQAKLNEIHEIMGKGYLEDVIAKKHGPSESDEGEE